MAKPSHFVEIIHYGTRERKQCRVSVCREGLLYLNFGIAGDYRVKLFGPEAGIVQRTRGQWSVVNIETARDVMRVMLAETRAKMKERRYGHHG